MKMWKVYDDNDGQQTYFDQKAHLSFLLHISMNWQDKNIFQKIVCFDCLFVVLRPTRVFFTHLEMITDEELQVLIYTWHSLPLISEAYLACHTYCGTGQPFILVISEDL
mgnify:CR=1 FL=1